VQIRLVRKASLILEDKPSAGLVKIILESSGKDLLIGRRAKSISRSLKTKAGTKITTINKRTLMKLFLKTPKCSKKVILASFFTNKSYT
tara:strand:- start:11493 stop:11759 length:267 start_codon:yes stop_codon:yes gene_type:complete